MDPSGLLATIGGAFLSKLPHETLFAVALIVMAWWIYKEAFWRRVVKR